MRFPAFALSCLAALTLLSSCGDQSLSTPEDLPITTYPKDKAFTLTLVMKSCSDVCAVYGAPSCAVAVDGNEISLDVEVTFTRDDSKVCSERCGTPILAHCEVNAIGAGTYTVTAGTFSRQITVR